MATHLLSGQASAVPVEAPFPSTLFWQPVPGPSEADVDGSTGSVARPVAGGRLGALFRDRQEYWVLAAR